MIQGQRCAYAPNDAIETVIALVTEALAQLDAMEAPADIGAHLDLALHRMRATISK